MRPPRSTKSAASRLRRVGGREHERLRILAGAQLPQALDRSGERELRAPEALDEVAAPAGADRLEVLQLGVDGAVAAGNAFAAHAVAGDDALPLEQELGEGAAVGRAGEEAVCLRPAALRRCRTGATCA